MNVCVYVGEGLRRSLATPDPFVLTNKICLNQLLNIINASGTRTSINKKYEPYIHLLC